MMHQFHDKRAIAKRRKLIRLSLGLFVFVLFCIGGLLVWPASFFQKIGLVFWKADTAVVDTIHEQGFRVRTKASVFAENDALLKENADLRLSMIDYTILKEENNQLKETLGRLPAKHSFILGTILAKPNISPYDTIIVDVGASEGIVEGLSVYANGIVPLGEVSKVYAHTSLLMLYSNPGQTTEASLEGSNASVELVGRGGGNFEMTIPIDLDSTKGASVVLPGSPTEIIATIEDIISSPNDPLKKVLLRSPVNIQNLKWVQIKKD